MIGPPSNSARAQRLEGPCIPPLHVQLGRPLTGADPGGLGRTHVRLGSTGVCPRSGILSRLGICFDVRGTEYTSQAQNRTYK